MESRNYLIAGGAGFIGSHLVEKLLESKSNVFLLDNFSSGSIRNLEHLCQNKFLTIYEIDITKNLPNFKKLDVIINLATIANTVEYEKYPIETLEVNSIGNRNLLELAVKHEANYIFFSSSEIYGHHEKYQINEETFSKLYLNQKRSPYFVGKIFGEELVNNFCKANSLDYLIVRPFNIYGPRMDVKTRYGRVIPNFINNALKNQQLVINGNGNQVRAFCYIDDFIECIMKILVLNSFNHNIVNIGNPEPTTILDLAKMINKIIGNQNGFIFRNRYPYEPNYRCPSIEKVKSWLNWMPKISLEKGLEKMISYHHDKYEVSEIESISSSSDI